MIIATLAKCSCRDGIFDGARCLSAAEEVYNPLLTPLLLLINEQRRLSVPKSSVVLLP